jgi:hypothetical protein
MMSLPVLLTLVELPAHFLLEGRAFWFHLALRKNIEIAAK